MEKVDDLVFDNNGPSPFLIIITIQSKNPTPKSSETGSHILILSVMTHEPK